MRRNNRQKALLVVLILMLLLCGCSRKQEKSKSETPSRVPDKFGATYMTMNNVYFDVLNDNLRTVIEANGDILVTRDPLQDQNKQNQQIEEMIEMGVKAIFLNPVDWKQVQPALEKCKEAGIPVFNIDSNVYDKSLITSTIVSDNYGAGVQCARDMMSKLDAAKIVVISHENINSTQLRVQGFMDTIKDKPQYEVVKKSEIVVELEVAMEEMERILASKVEFDVVLGGNDPTALGALAAMQLNHYDKKVLLYGVDGSPDAKAIIKAHYMTGTSAQSPKQIGTISGETAYKYLAGEKVDRYIMVPVTLITEDNLADFDIAGWQ